MNVLLSTPRSGNTWLRYIISVTSEMMCVDSMLKNSIHELLYGTPKFPLTLSTLEKTVCKAHDLELIANNYEASNIIGFYSEEGVTKSNVIWDSLKDNKAKLVFIIRYYEEIVFRALMDGERDWYSVLWDYIKSLKQYDNYKGPKLLIKLYGIDALLGHQFMTKRKNFS